MIEPEILPVVVRGIVLGGKADVEQATAWFQQANCNSVLCDLLSCLLKMVTLLSAFLPLSVADADP